MREGVLQPHARNDRERFLPHGPGLFRVYAKSSHFNEGGRAPGAQLNPAIAENVENRGPFREYDVLAEANAERPKREYEMPACACVPDVLTPPSASIPSSHCE